MRKENGLKLQQNNDKLVNCPCCTSNACYESEFQTQEGIIQTWLCMTCGFTSNSTMLEDSETLKEIEEYTADLIRDLKQVHNKLVWFPTVITMPEKGMIFPEPIKSGETFSRSDDKTTTTPLYGWTVVKAIPIEKEEKEKYPNPNKPGHYYQYKMDMKNPIRFDKLCFMDAAEVLGMFKYNQK
jgi:transcription elongation factor Elf1